MMRLNILQKQVKEGKMCFVSQSERYSPPAWEGHGGRSVRWLVTFASVVREQRVKDAVAQLSFSSLFGPGPPIPWNGAATFRVGLLTLI